MPRHEQRFRARMIERLEPKLSLSSIGVSDWQRPLAPAALVRPLDDDPPPNPEPAPPANPINGPIQYPSLPPSGPLGPG